MSGSTNMFQNIMSRNFKIKIKREVVVDQAFFLFITIYIYIYGSLSEFTDTYNNFECIVFSMI